MSDMEIVDTRGLSCPAPALLAQRTLRRVKKGTVAVLVDSGTARENVARLAGNAGWSVTVEDQPDGACRLVLRR